jgi:hypothetical protein
MSDIDAPAAWTTAHCANTASNATAFLIVLMTPNAIYKALAKREAICQSSAQCARTLMNLLGSCFPYSY